ncbi:MAG: ComF family protein [Psychrosphaera sp.]|nr:ComF family protein [Psychrosphaera sp.]
MPTGLNRFIPNRCVLCKLITSNTISLCNCCANDLDYFNYCQFDNLLLRPDIRQGIKKPRFDSLISLAPYQWPFDQWITDLKFREQHQLGELMARQLLRLVQNLLQASTDGPPDVILPMPIHRNRRFTRGYNQSKLIAEVLAKPLNITLDNQSLTRVKSTSAQSGLNKTDRQSNVKQAFTYTGPVYRHAAVIDDVITTGATLNEVCKVLKEKGIERISVWTICAVPLQKKKQKK